jgi:hypothetical protein
VKRKAGDGDAGEESLVGGGHACIGGARTGRCTPCPRAPGSLLIPSATVCALQAAAAPWQALLHAMHAGVARATNVLPRWIYQQAPV